VQRRGWRIPGNENIVLGSGYRVWIDKYTNATSKFDNIGTVLTGTLNFPSLTRNDFANCQVNISPATISCTEAWRGWNLLSNPYPCPIDWDASGAGTWNKPAQLNNVFYTWNSANNSYRAYVGLGGDLLGETYAPNGNTPPNVIPSSQAFFVKLVTPGTYSANLSIGENAKITSTNGTFARTSVANNQVKIRMTNNEVQNIQYDGMVRFDPSSTFGFDQNLDADAFLGSHFGFSITGENGEGLVLNTVPLPTESKVIPMSMVYNGMSGNYKFSFLDAESISNGAEVFLKDNYLGTLTSMNSSNEYLFTAIVNDASSSPERFEIIISPNSTTGSNIRLNGVSFGIRPNPASGSSKVTLAVNGVKDVDASITVTDMVGKVVFRGTMNLTGAELNEKSFDLGLASGVYTVKFNSSSKSFTEKLIVR
jgi:hypothetical protein